MSLNTLSIDFINSEILQVNRQIADITAYPVPPHTAGEIARKLAVLNAYVADLIASQPALTVPDSTADLITVRKASDGTFYVVPLNGVSSAPAVGAVLQYVNVVGANADFPITLATYADTGFSVALGAVLSKAANVVRIRAQFSLEFGYDQPLHLYSFSLLRGAVDITPAQGAMIALQKGNADNGVGDQISNVTFEWEDAPGAVGINTYHLIARGAAGLTGTIIGTIVPVVMRAEEINT